MPGGVMELVRSANRTRRPEDSVPLRVVVLAAVMIAALALIAEGAVSYATGALLMVALPFAYWVSYRRRSADNWHIKIAVTIAALFALARFLGQLGAIATLDEVRFPLAELFLWVQVLHGFDLPARKDLSFSLGSSLTLMAVAGSLSQSLTFGLFLLVYVVLVVAALVLSHRSEVGERAQAWMTPKVGARHAATPRPVRDTARAVGVTAVAAGLLFLVIPQPTTARTFALPFSLGGGAGLFGGGAIANPGFSGSPGSRVGASSYYGFSERMDLRVRGDLPDTLVMRVRSSAPAMWRGIIFERYDGVAWTGDVDDPIELGDTPPFHYPPEFRSLGPRQTISQTFYIEAEQASVVFAGGQPDTVWFEGGVNIDDLGGLRTDSTLTPGTVYSVVSTRGAATAEQLRAIPREVPAAFERYLQLPAGVPARVEDLARRITRGAKTDFDRVLALEAYMRDNYRYSIDSPVPPPGQDAVDHFLFETDVGFCEQFASATVVMLRSLGIPARVVAGFTPGGRNPFTGYYEVRASDAHSWIEVWFPRLGWYEFDPTFAVPPATTDVADVVPLAKVLRAVGSWFEDVSPAGMARIFRSAFVVLLGVTVAVGLWIARRRLRRRARAPRPALDPMAGPVTRALTRLDAALHGAGKQRREAETASELLERTAGLERPVVDHALRTFERERYGSAPPAAPDTHSAVAELDRLAQELVGGKTRR